MPDHVHSLFRLGASLTLSQVAGKLKQLSRKKSGVSPISWQGGYHDHKLRSDDELHPILHYIYMNPYRAKLIPRDQIWPYTHIHPEQWAWFKKLLNKDCPYPEWLTD